MKTTNTIKHDGLFHTMEWEQQRTHLETGPIDIASTVEWDEVLWDASITMANRSPDDFTITWTNRK